MATNRRGRRAQAKAAGTKVLLRELLVIEGAAISEAVANGASPSDLVLAHVQQLVESLAQQGGDPFAHCVVTFGTDHPDYPGALTIEAKTDRMMTAEQRIAAGIDEVAP